MEVEPHDFEPSVGIIIVMAEFRRSIHRKILKCPFREELDMRGVLKRSSGVIVGDLNMHHSSRFRYSPQFLHYVNRVRKMLN
jgi:hypothetical protein